MSADKLGKLTLLPSWLDAVALLAIDALFIDGAAAAVDVDDAGLEDREDETDFEFPTEAAAEPEAADKPPDLCIEEDEVEKLATAPALESTACPARDEGIAPEAATADADVVVLLDRCL